MAAMIKRVRIVILFIALAFIQAYAFCTPSSVQARGMRGSTDDAVSRNRTVNAGVKTQIWTAWELTPDCQVVRGFNVKIVRTPDNGVATLEKIQKVIDQSWLNQTVPQRKRTIVQGCMGRTVMTIGVFYTSRVTAPATDNVGLLRTDASGSHRREVDIAIDIR
jgi:hypothetical protein